MPSSTMKRWEADIVVLIQNNCAARLDAALRQPEYIAGTRGIQIRRDVLTAYKEFRQMMAVTGMRDTTPGKQSIRQLRGVVAGILGVC